MRIPTGTGLAVNAIKKKKKAPRLILIKGLELVVGKSPTMGSLISGLTQ